MRAKGKRREALLVAAEAMFTDDLAGRVLGFESDAARARLATRNKSDFADCGINVIDPWNQSLNSEPEPSNCGGEMGKGRLEAFSDGVIAIIITIMVLEMKVPHGDGAKICAPLLPVFLSYVLSFVYVGIYWNNHHHMLHCCTTVTGGVLWANLHLLFWLSLFPFATGWMGENHFAVLPTALYGVVLLMAAIAYYVLQQAIIRTQGPDSS